MKQRSVSKKRCVVAVVLTAGIVFISACTSGDVRAGPKPGPTTSPVSDVSAGEAEECAKAETDGPDTATLGLSDVWPIVGGENPGGEAISVKDLRRCAGSVDRAASFPLCRLGFPWRTAARADADLAALGVVGVQLKQLVKSPDAFVNETILSFDGPKSASAAQLVKESIGCGQGNSPSQGSKTDRTKWLRTSSGSRLALVESGSRLIAVEFADSTLKQAHLQTVVDKAMKLAANLG